MLIAILLNGLIIFLLYFPAFHDNEWLIQLDHLFILIFLIEAIVKIAAYGWNEYIKNNWNKFDFFIVIASLPALLSSFLVIPNTGILKILRLLRLIRLVKFLTFIPHMSSILAGLVRAMKASVFVIIALFFLNFLLALFTCHFFGAVAPEYFGDPLISSYTIFQFFTVEGWNEIPAVIAERMDNDIYIGLSRFYFVLVVLAGGIFGMSLANAIFVDEMTMDNNVVLEDKIDQLQGQIAELKNILQEKNNS